LDLKKEYNMKRNSNMDEKEIEKLRGIMLHKKVV
jgi:hypothetical protein